MFNPEKVIFKLDKDFNENGVPLKAGFYNYAELVKLYGSEQTLNYCFTCTSLKDALIEVKEEKKMDKTIIENKAFLGGFENKTELDKADENIETLNTEELTIEETVANKEELEEETVEDTQEELTLEELKKIADEKGIQYHHRAGIEKLKSLIKESE